MASPKSTRDWGEPIDVAGPLGRWAPFVVPFAIAGAILFTSLVQIPADSVGVLLRFGRFTDTLQPGLRVKMPLGIDRVLVVPIQRQLKLEFGFGTPGATNIAQYAGSGEQQEERSMVTGDLNMAQVEWVVQYRIEDARQFLFHVRDPHATLRDAGESVMREAVGDRTVDEVLTIGRQEIEAESLRRLQELAVRYGLGCAVMQVQLKNVHPPGPVQDSFNEVNQAQQEPEQAINMAVGEYNRAVPRARGEAEQRQSQAQGYALQRVNEAKGDTERFNAQLAEYLKAPEITRTRLYHETMSAVLSGLERKVILDPQTGGPLPLLSLDGRPPEAGIGAAMPEPAAPRQGGTR